MSRALTRMVPSRRSMVGLIILASLGSAVAVVARVAIEPLPQSISEYLGWHTNSATNEAEVVQALTATCMQRQGFQYEAFVAPTPSALEEELDAREWAEVWGLGISTRVGVEAPPEEAPDPNMVYLDTLPSAEQASYRSALNSPQGCMTLATKTVYGRFDRALAPLRLEFEDLAARLAADPRIAKAREVWLACVGGSGFNTATKQDFLNQVTASFEDRVNALLASGVGHLDRAELAEVVADERRIAVLIVDCDENYQTTYKPVQAEFESAFIAAHKSEMDQMTADLRRFEATIGLGLGAPLAGTARPS